MKRRNLKTARQKLAAFTKCPYSSRKDFNAADWMIHDIRKILKGSYYIMGLKSRERNLDAEKMGST